jgi:hypothetical protein
MPHNTRASEWVSERLTVTTAPQQRRRREKRESKAHLNQNHRLRQGLIRTLRPALSAAGCGWYIPGVRFIIRGGLSCQDNIVHSS